MLIGYRTLTSSTIRTKLTLSRQKFYLLHTNLFLERIIYRARAVRKLELISKRTKLKVLLFRLTLIRNCN